MLERALLRVLRSRLIADLADGVAPTKSRRHWRCADQLLARARRRELALGLERLIEEADHPTQAISAAIPPQRRQVRDARPTLVAIIDALRSPGPVGVQGVAMVARLLADGAGPIYAPAPPGALAELAESVLDALAEPSTTTEPALPA
jgi:hypothetical protein